MAERVIVPAVWEPSVKESPFSHDFLPGATAGDETEDTSTEFTDSIEEEAAHNSHQQVSQCQV